MQSKTGIPFHPFSVYRFEPETLVDILRWRANNQADRPAYIFLADVEKKRAEVTYAELDHQARVISGFLQSLTASQERALLLYPPGLEYVSAFFACLYAGIIAVPAYPPKLNR